MTHAQIVRAIVAQIYAGVEDARAAGVTCGLPFNIHINKEN